MMKRFISRIWNSSQPTIKQEQEESPSASVIPDVQGENEENGKGVDNENMEDVIAKEQEESFNGFGEENGEGVGGEFVKGKAEKKARKGEKKGRKGRKGRKSQEAEEQEQEAEKKLGGTNEDVSAATGDEEIPGELVFEGDGEETMNTGLDSQFDDNEYTEPAPKSKRSRKSNSTTKKRKQNTAESNSVPETEEIGPGEQEAEEPAIMLTKTKLSKNKARSSRSGKARKARKAVAEEDTQEPEATQDTIADGDNSVPADLAALPKKLKRAKKARVSSHKVFEEIVTAPEEDGNDSAPVLHKPFTSTHISHHRTGSNSQDDSIEAATQLRKDAQSVAPADPEESETIAKQPSEKALGKRKASEMEIAATKKRKVQKDKAPGTPDLAAFGFTQSSGGSSAAILRESQQRVTPAFTPINGPKSAILPPAQKALAESEVGIDSDESDWVPEVPKSMERKKKRRLPIGDDEPSKINPKTPQKRSGKSKTPNSEAKTSSRPTKTNGRLSNDEIEAISKAVEEYRDQNDLNQVEINDLIQKDAKTDGLRLWKYVYDEVPHIPHAKILNLCRRKFHNFEARGSWNEEQDQELREAYEKYPGKWKQIGESMNRFAEDCRDRWRNYLVCGDNLRKDVWDKEEEERFREVVQESLQAIREMKRVSDDPRAVQASDESLVDWNVVSQKMNRTRSRLQCLNKWKKLKEREEVDVEDPVIAQPISETWRLEEAERLARRMKTKEKRQLLYAIRDSGAGREGKIPWRRVQEELPGKARKMALRVCFRQMRQHIEDNEDMKLQDIVDLLIDAFEAAAPAEPTGYDDFDSFRSSQRRLSRKKRKSISEMESSDDNGEGPSTVTTTKRQSRLSEKYVMDDEEDDIWTTPQDKEPPKSSRKKTTSTLQGEENHVNSSGAKKKKFRQRMKDAGQCQSQSQETDRHHSELSDIHTALESLRTGKSKSQSASTKKPIRALSNERVFETDEEETSVNEDHEADADIMDFETLEKYTAPGGPEADEDVMDLDKLDSYTSPGGPEVEDGDFSFEDEEASLKHYDQESVDLDEDRIVSTNGAHDDHEDEESDFQDAGSIDLDTAVQKTYERHGGKSKRLVSPELAGEETSKVNGFVNGYYEEEERVSSDDDDMSDIPAKIAPKVIEPKKEKSKSKSKKRRLELR